MDIKEAKILWNKNGPVKVISMKQIETEDEKNLSASYGACNFDWIEASDSERIILMFSLFVRMVVEYGISPQDAHAAFLAIDQYQDNI